MNRAPKPSIPAICGYHVACLALPSPRPDDIARLAEDIRRNGLREPVLVTEDGLIIDGRARCLACVEAGVKVRYCVIPETETRDVAARVMSIHITRRHYTKSQRAMAAERLAFLSGERAERSRVKPAPRTGRRPASRRGLSKDRAADVLGVAPAQARKARVIRNRDLDLAEKVESGETSIAAAYDEVRQPVEPGVQPSVARCDGAQMLARELVRLDATTGNVISRSTALRLLAMEARRLGFAALGEEGVA